MKEMSPPPKKKIKKIFEWLHFVYPFFAFPFSAHIAMRPLNQSTEQKIEQT